jgi:hypothetical protein
MYFAKYKALGPMVACFDVQPMTQAILVLNYNPSRKWWRQEKEMVEKPSGSRSSCCPNRDPNYTFLKSQIVYSGFLKGVQCIIIDRFTGVLHKKYKILTATPVRFF